jgi:hypothetical protein
VAARRAATMTKRRHKGAGSARDHLSQAIRLVGESQALSYALVMALASTPHERFSRKEIDALCEVAYELPEKLTKALRDVSRDRSYRSLAAAGKIQPVVQ